MCHFSDGFTLVNMDVLLLKREKCLKKIAKFRILLLLKPEDQAWKLVILEKIAKHTLKLEEITAELNSTWAWILHPFVHYKN